VSAAGAPRQDERTTDPGARERGASLAILTSGVLIVAKLLLALVTGSVAVLAEAAHSASDLLASVVAAIAVRNEERAGGPDVQLGAVEGVFVVGASGVIVFAAVRQLGDPVELPGVALVGMLACSAVAAVVAGRLRRLASITGSPALAADAEHLRDAAATAGAVVLALGLVELTGIREFDALAAIVIAVVIARSGFDLLLGLRPGHDPPAPAELDAVARAVAAGPPELVGYRRPRARTAGGVRRLDVVVTVRRDVPGTRTRSIREELARELAERLPGVRVVVRVVPPAS
jgi:cation diffusion facilitator family transporter